MFTHNFDFYCARKGVQCQSMNCWSCQLPDVGYYYTAPTTKKRIIEKFDEKGNLIERIIEDV